MKPTIPVLPCRTSFGAAGGQSSLFERDIPLKAMTFYRVMGTGAAHGRDTT